MLFPFPNFTGLHEDHCPIYTYYPNFYGINTANGWTSCGANSYAKYQEFLSASIRSMCNAIPPNGYLLGVPEPKRKQPDKPVWQETDLFWIVISEQAGPLKLLEIVLKEVQEDGSYDCNH